MEPRKFAVSVPAEAGFLKIVRGFLEGVLKESEAAVADPDDMVLALDEACSNVIKHRCETLDDGMIHVSLEVGPEDLKIRIGCFCLKEEVPLVKPRGIEEGAPGGLGTSFVHQIMDRVTYQPDLLRPGSVALVLEKKLGTGGGANDAE